MAVYVDTILHHGGSATFRRKRSCPMFSDRMDELHAMALSIGLKRSWFQTSRSGLPHYDLTESKQKQALAKGAVLIKGKALWRKFQQLRKPQE